MTESNVGIVQGLQRAVDVAGGEWAYRPLLQRAIRALSTPAPQVERQAIAPSVDRFKDRVAKYVVQLNATGQADLAHLLRRDADALLAAILALGSRDDQAIREKCAKIVDERAQQFEDDAPFEDSPDYTERCKVYAKHLSRAAAAIRESGGAR